MNFETDYEKIIDQIKAFDPSPYGRSRNYLSGAVSRFSPWISHGVITPAELVENLALKYGYRAIKDFVFQLSWREYFQNIYRALGDDIFSEIRVPKRKQVSNDFPAAIIDAQTGIEVIDFEIERLIKEGYLHNHSRLWIAGLFCNFAKSYWANGARWFFYHLLDGDLASNTLSWQWVCGSFSSKPYLFNQENVNKFSRTEQKGTLIDCDYSGLAALDLKKEFGRSDKVFFETELGYPDLSELKLSPDSKVFVYHPWMLDPLWRKNESAVKILFFEEEFFTRFPISKKRIEFIENLSKNIPDILIVKGSIKDLSALCLTHKCYSIFHNDFRHWPINFDQPEKIFPMVDGFFPSFFKFWNKGLKSRSEFK